MDTLENLEPITSIWHIARFLKSGIPTYNFQVLDTAGRKATRRRLQAVEKRFAFHTNAINYN